MFKKGWKSNLAAEFMINDKIKYIKYKKHLI